eukprot:133098_1
MNTSTNSNASVHSNSSSLHTTSNITPHNNVNNVPNSISHNTSYSMNKRKCSFDSDQPNKRLRLVSTSNQTITPAACNNPSNQFEAEEEDIWGDLDDSVFAQIDTIMTTSHTNNNNNNGTVNPAHGTNNNNSNSNNGYAPMSIDSNVSHTNSSYISNGNNSANRTGHSNGSGSISLDFNGIESLINALVLEREWMICMLDGREDYPGFQRWRTTLNTQYTSDVQRYQSFEAQMNSIPAFKEMNPALSEERKLYLSLIRSFDPNKRPPLTWNSDYELTKSQLERNHAFDDKRKQIMQRFASLKEKKIQDIKQNPSSVQSMNVSNDIIAMHTSNVDNHNTSANNDLSDPPPQSMQSNHQNNNSNNTGGYVQYRGGYAHGRFRNIEVDTYNTLDPVRWYFINDYGKRMPIYDRLSKDINEMNTGTNKKVTIRAKTYDIRKITSAECIQRNIKTNKVRHLTTSKQNDDDYKTDIDDNDKPNTFVPRCLTHQEALQLLIGQQVDIRSATNGFMYKGTVTKIKTVAIVDQNIGLQITIHYIGDNKHYKTKINIDKTYHNELHRLAKYESISIRASHRFKNVEYIDINPIYLDPGWKPGKILFIRSFLAQIQVEFRHSVSKQLIKYWVHPDNTNECAAFGTGRIDMEQVKALFHRTVSPAKYEIIQIEDVSACNMIHRNIYESILKSKEKPLHEIEKYMWHGTDVLDLILKNGFDRSYNEVGMYGRGTYFATD